LIKEEEYTKGSQKSSLHFQVLYIADSLPYDYLAWLLAPGRTQQCKDKPSC